VPWKRRHGYATEAVRLMLPEARQVGLSYIEITTSVGNIGSQIVITANGGVLIEKFTTGPRLGSQETLRFRIDL